MKYKTKQNLNGLLNLSVIIAFIMLFFSLGANFQSHNDNKIKINTTTIDYNNYNVDSILLSYTNKLSYNWIE